MASGRLASCPVSSRGSPALNDKFWKVAKGDATLGVSFKHRVRWYPRVRLSRASEFVLQRCVQWRPDAHLRKNRASFGSGVTVGCEVSLLASVLCHEACNVFLS